MGKQQFRIKQSRVNVVNARDDPNNSEFSYYWDDFHKKKREGEDVRANPDELEYNFENLLWPTKQTTFTETEQDVIQSIKSLDLKTILTPREIEVIKLIVNRNKKFREIRNALGLSRQRLHTIIKSIGDKLRKIL